MSERRRNRAGLRSALDRLDGWMHAGGERLAGRSSRRGFIESVGEGAAAVGILSQARGASPTVCDLPPFSNNTSCYPNGSCPAGSSG